MVGRLLIISILYKKSKRFSHVLWTDVDRARLEVICLPYSRSIIITINKIVIDMSKNCVNMS